MFIIYSSHCYEKFIKFEIQAISILKPVADQPGQSSLRSVRAKASGKNAMRTGHDLAAGLVKNSARGDAYVKEIRSMIRTNKLKKYDEKFWNDAVVS